MVHHMSLSKTLSNSNVPISSNYNCIIFRKEILEIRRGKADLCKALRVINWPALKLVSHTYAGFHLENSSRGGGEM